MTFIYLQIDRGHVHFFIVLMVAAALITTTDIIVIVLTTTVVDFVMKAYHQVDHKYSLLKLLNVLYVLH